MKKKSKMKLVTVILCVAFTALALSACGDDVDDVIDDPDISERTEDVVVQLYFANADYVNTGTETAETPMMMPAYEQKLLVEKDDMKDVYEKAIEKLEVVPSDKYLSIISENIDFEDIYLKGDTCIVNIDPENLFGGAMEEELFINQIVSTLCNSFDEVKQVEFMVGGKKVDTLMGQMDATLPFTADKNGKAVQVK